MRKNAGLRKKTGSEAFGKLLRSFRKKNKLTGEKLAKLSGVDRTHISKIENGVHNPDFPVVKRISEALNEPDLIKIYLLKNLPQIDKYYEKINGPSSLAKTILIDILYKRSDQEIINSFSKSIKESEQNAFLELIRELRKAHNKADEFSKKIIQARMNK